MFHSAEASALLRENAEIQKHRAVQGRQAFGTPVFPARCPGKAFFWAFLSGMSEPLGGLLAWLVLKESWGEGWREGCGKLVHHLFQRISNHSVIDFDRSKLFLFFTTALFYDVYGCTWLSCKCWILFTIHTCLPELFVSMIVDTKKHDLNS